MKNKAYFVHEKYEMGKLLGQGAFAKVHYARNMVTGAGVAIKIIDKEKTRKAGLSKNIKREISVMKMVKHPNIVELHEVLATKSKIFLVMEYVRGGDLLKKIARERMNEETVRKYFQQIVSAVEFCHSKGIVHRDLKLENILLDEFGNVKVTDFGLSAMAESKRRDGLFHTACGTPTYVAPEVITQKGYDGFKADVWSCGVILFVLLTRRLPFHDPSLMEMYRMITMAELKFPSCVTAEARMFLRRILDPNPKTRISIDEIMENCWFKEGLEGDDHAAKGVKDTMKCINAFEIIACSSGLDLGALFGEVNDQHLIAIRVEEILQRIRVI